MHFAYGEKETEYLSMRDKKLAEVIEKVGHIDREVDTDLFSSVVHHIICSSCFCTVFERLAKP